MASPRPDRHCGQPDPLGTGDAGRRPTHIARGSVASLTAMASRNDSGDLRDIWLFSACSASQLKTIRKAVEEIEVDAGRVLCEEGSVGREFFFIREGSAVVKRKGRKVATLGPGAYFGELSLLDRMPRSATVVSETPMRLLVLDQRRFGGLLDDMPALAHKLLVAMSGRLREADARVVVQ